ncbi:hypothetical protein OVS_04265 [Mycoplasma ovis str. Michigan]|uniref:Secreted protein n=1 Tax=Mycoplasma ovis str. Michigan TaxID=1415773 RepID=A0ABM5P291_9MOLU|nr:hypothetical protein [Mycoplasma ovis]AHC40580.1 hypothetical protein OVS_04265 [Mycoplasma ovis str. Michigan]
MFANISFLSLKTGGGLVLLLGWCGTFATTTMFKNFPKDCMKKAKFKRLRVRRECYKLFTNSSQGELIVCPDQKEWTNPVF